MLSLVQCRCVGLRRRPVLVAGSGPILEGGSRQGFSDQEQPTVGTQPVRFKPWYACKVQVILPITTESFCPVGSLKDLGYWGF